MSETNDTATVEQSNTTEETGGENTQSQQPNDLSELKALIQSQNESIKALEGRLNRQSKKEVRKDSDTPQKINKESDRLEEQLKALQLQVAGITDEDEVSLVERLYEETQMPLEKLLTSKYFKLELEEVRTQKQNAVATSNIKGDKGSKSNARNTADYWIAKGEVPTADQADRKLRAQVIRAFVNQNKTGGKKFYNE